MKGVKLIALSALFGLSFFVTEKVLPSSSSHTPPKTKPFTLEELKKLENGEVVFTHEERQISESEQTSLLVVSVLITQPEEVLWIVLDHPEREKEWIPFVKKSEVVKDFRPTPTTRVNVTDYVISGFGLEVYYSLVREYDYAAKKIVGHLDKTRPHKYFLDIHNWWNFFPHKNGIIFQYSSDSRLVVNIPRVISEKLAEKNLISGIGAIRNRCDFIAKEMRR